MSAGKTELFSLTEIDTETPLAELIQETWNALRGRLDVGWALESCIQIHDLLADHFGFEEETYYPTIIELRPDLENSFEQMIQHNHRFLELLDFTIHLLRIARMQEAEPAFGEAIAVLKQIEASKRILLTHLQEPAYYESAAETGYTSKGLTH